VSIKLYLISVDEYPEGIADPESLLLISDEDSAEDVSLDSLNYMTTVGVKSSHSEKVISEFKEWWRGNTKGDLSVELLAESESQIEAHRLNEISTIDPESWTMKNSFIAYPKNCQESYTTALEIVKEGELNLQ